MSETTTTRSEKPSLRERIRGFRPSAITQGAPIYPMLVLFGLNAADELDRQAFAVLVPNIQEHFGLSIQGILTVTSLVAVSVLFLEIPLAHYADRRSRVRIAAGGATAFGAFSFATGLAPNVATLGIARAGSGLGRAVTGATHPSLLSDYYKIDARPSVFAFHNAANAVGQFVGPLLGGLIAFYLGWRWPFFFFAIPTIVLVVLALRLKEPVRGAHERRQMGANEETVGTEETPASFAEGMRMLWQVRSLRRVWMGIPILATAVVGLAPLLQIFYEQELGLDERERGFLAAANEPFQLIGLAIGIPIANKLLRRNPALLVRFLGAALVATALGVAFIVISESLPVAIVATCVLAAARSSLTPGLITILSLVIPPRVRSLGFTVGNLFIVPGYFIAVIIGGFADDWGIRRAMLLLIPIYILGAVIWATAGSFIPSDMNKVRTSAVAMSEVRAARKRGQVKLLLAKDVDVAYDNVQVLFGVNFEVDEGEIVALLGTNGAGKSTLLKSISGLVEASSGAFIFDGSDMTYAPPHEIVARGIVQVPGGKGVFPTLTVAENLKIAGWLYRRDDEYTKQATEQVLGYFPILRDRWNQVAGNLSGGEQQMLTLGMAFIAKPRLLMIDELSLGLAPVIVEQLLEIVRAIRERGTTIILVEQSVNVALSLAETAYFMEKGEIRFHGPTAELLDRPDILRSVFLEGAASVTGVDVERSAPGRAKTPATARRGNGAPSHAPAVLEVDGLSKSYGGVRAVDGVTFELEPGQVLGFIGPNGAGKTSVFDLISGFVLPDAGRVTFDGQEITHLHPDTRARMGLGRSFQDARLFPALTVADTIAFALEGQVEVRDPVAAALNLPAVAESEAKVQERVDELIDLMGLGAFRDKFVAELSTGSRRIVDLACVLAHEPKVLLFDEPSSGIAQRETEALGPLLLRIREATNSALLVIEHDMPLITGIADEIVALDLGAVITQGTPREVVNHPRVVASYLGTSETVIARSGTVPGLARPSGRPARKAPAKRTAVRKSVAKKFAVKKSAVKKSAVKKSAVKKPASGRAVAKKK